MSTAPWMLVTAAVDPAIRVEFDAWHRDSHLPHVLAIPGIVKGRRLSVPPGAANYAAIFVFEDDAALRSALASAEARAARSDWERWDGHIRDLTLHFYGELSAGIPLYRQN